MHDQVINIFSKKWVIPAAVGVTSFGSGLLSGYFLGKRNVDDVFSENKEDSNQSYQLKFDFNQAASEMTKTEYLEQIINRVPPEFNYAKIITVDEYPEWELDTEADLMLEEDELQEAVEEQTHQELITNDGDNTPEIINVFDNQVYNDQWNYEDELSVRTENAPYVISVNEFVSDEAGCEQSTVTYYVGDDIMADEFDIPIYGFNEMMGDLKFGHGSNDSTVVYIRNEKLGLEWEVLHHTGRFDIEVLGHDVENAYEKAELKHSVPRYREE